MSIIPLHIANQLLFTMNRECVFYELGTEIS